ncbi:MAG TPA: phage scaffolding protein [Anaerolineaceae bacterium]|nr:phage scaffolding protein [Anaerolineaceae bacterium]
MNKKDLEKLGLTAEAIEKAGLGSDVLDQIIILHGKDIEKHKTDLSAAQSELDGAKKQLEEANKTIESFKAMKPEELQKAADDWKAKAEVAKAEADKTIAGLKFDHALDGALTTAKAKNAKAVKALLKTDDLKLADDGSIVGLNEQLEKIKSENDYLFESDTPDPKIITGGKQTTDAPTGSFAEAIQERLSKKK